MEVSPTASAEMNAKDLKALGLKDGDMVRITASDGSSIQTVVRRSRRAVEGSIIVPHHFSSVRLNSLTRWTQAAVKIKVEKV